MHLGMARDRTCEKTNEAKGILKLCGVRKVQAFVEVSSQSICTIRVDPLSALLNSQGLSLRAHSTLPFKSVCVYDASHQGVFNASRSR